MQEVQIVRWCDNHLKLEGIKTAALPRPKPVTIEDVQTELDLCAECDMQLLQPLRDLLAAVHSRASRPSTPDAGRGGEDGSQAAMTQCPLDGTWLSIRGRAAHVRSKHPEMAVGEVDWRFNETVDEVWPCGCGLTFPNPRSRVAHNRRKDTEACHRPMSDESLSPKRPI